VKHLHKFYNNDVTPWVQLVKDSYYFDSVPHAISLTGSFWRKDVFSLSDQYRAITGCEIGNAIPVLFWSDLWKDETLDIKFSRLFSFTKDKLQSGKDFFLV
jgi:hypothetical protein